MVDSLVVVDVERTGLAHGSQTGTLAAATDQPLPIRAEVAVFVGLLTGPTLLGILETLDVATDAVQRPGLLVTLL
jgi:hypothetical protein